MAETLRILVCDDEPGMRLGVVRALRSFKAVLPDIDEEINFDVDQAETGEEALQKISAQTPDILLLDYKLPGMTGLDVLEKVGVDPADMLTVMITAYASLETAITATKRGAYDFLPKPFTPDELKNTIRKTAGRLVLARQARKLAEEKRQVRFQFISVLAHELKAPIAAIMGYLRIMEDKSAGDDPTVYDQMVDRCIVRLDGMQKLIYDLLDLTRIESGQKKRQVSEVDVVEVARRSIETVLPDARNRQIDVNLHAPDSLTMTGDASELEIILNNLTSNAVKYNRDGGRVDVTLSATDEETTLAVSDTGIGMTPEQQERLFGEFVRIKTPQTRNILGSGLGLSILKKLIHLYDGEVDVQSEPEMGTTFTVTLKRHHEFQPEEATEESATA
ncbi:MAG: sensor histidine kinase [Phycisphaerae bacterium]